MCSEQYARQLKQLINYLRFEIKPKRPESKAYRLYVANWGTVTPQPSHGSLIDTCPPTAAGLLQNGS
ncbi:hypothetical protein [Desulfosarcina cetonica]|uniref:hypothetical protein n=1 Tax=Desulfosarcina cetonica TaxID=90730 RepID=UPI00155DB01F|nr:hypothetical protein [Desulfosarcina cetonica]